MENQYPKMKTPRISGGSVFIATILLVVLVSWIGVLDRASARYVNGTLGKATVTFGSARAINGVLSVAKSTTVSIPVVGGLQVTPGELLEPIDDLVENYAAAMKLAMASLVIQRVMLSVVSATVFKVLLTLSGLALVVGAMLKGTAPINFLFRVFVSLTFLRFILVAAVLLNGIVNHAFIDRHRDEAVGRLNVLSGELNRQVSAVSDLTPGALGGDLVSIEKDLDIAKRSFEDSKATLKSVRDKTTLAERLNPFQEHKSLDAAEAGVKEAEVRLNDVLVRRCVVLREAADAGTHAACKEVPLKAWARMLVVSAEQAVSRQGSKAAVASGFNGLRQVVDRAAIDFVTAMALFILQTLILPLLFLFALSRATRWIWGVDLAELVANVKRVPFKPA